VTQSLKQFRKYEDVLALKDHGLPYRFDQIFRTESWGARRASKQKLKILQAFEPLLSRMLRPDELVYYVCYGVQNSAFEQAFLGWVAFYLNRRVFVFTTQRVLVVQFGSGYVPDDLKSELPYANITDAKGSLLGGLRLHLADGRKMVFSGMPGPDRKTVVTIVTTLRGEPAAGAGPKAGLVNLCPHCYQPVSGYPIECASCHGRFKSARIAGLLSLVFPGFGDMYLGHRLFAAMEILGAGLVWLGLLLSAAEEPPLSSSELATVAAVLFALMHGIDAAVTYHVGRKGIYPAVTPVPVTQRPMP